MARIPTDEIERIKRDIPIQRLAEARGVELKRHGSNLIGLCPFHDDNEPSLVISPDKNLWHCLGACQAGGSVIDWVMRAQGVSFRHAVEILRSDLALAPGSPRPGTPAPKRSQRQKLPSLLDASVDDQRLLYQVLDYYHETLKQSPEALAYLERRGLKHPELIDRFRLGFANRTLGYRLPPKRSREGSQMRGRLQRLGVLRASGHEHFNGCLVIPVFDEQGRVLEVYSRKITPGLPKRVPLHLYLPGPHHGVLNVEALAASREVILCEALIDALTFWCAGFRNVTASYGIEGFTEDHLDAFRRYGTERVLIAYDRDEAGERAAEKLADLLGSEGIECFRVQFPRGMDANEYALKVTPAAKSLGLVLRKAVWLGGACSEAVPVGRASESGAAGRAGQAGAGAPDARPGSTSAVAAAKEKKERGAQAASAEASAESGDAGPARKSAEDASSPERALPSPLPLVASAASAPQPAASPVPAPPRVEIAAQVSEQQVVIGLRDRRYRVRGLADNLSFGHLKVNLLCSMQDALHVDTLDLYSARQRASFVKEAAVELGVDERVLKQDLGRVLLELEHLQEEQIRRAFEPERKEVELTEKQRGEAMELLRDPKLLVRILSDFERCGVVGERSNKLMGYLAAVSRKLEEPLAVIIQSSSAAGKSALMDAVLAFVPEEDRVKYSAMTGQSLFYMGEKDLQHKVLAIVEEEGAERASYALKLLQSEGELSIASTGKDPKTGRLVTQEYRVQGPVMIFLTTTAMEIDEELLNRCVVLTVDEEREQTRAIHRVQRERQTLQGLLALQDRARILDLHRNAQRLLRPLLVANPYAQQLTFLDDRTRTRRDHMKYLTLIRSIALLHQHQRPVRSVQHEGRAVEYIEVSLDDIEQANDLANEVLGRSLDELPAQTRRLLMLLDGMVSQACEELELQQPEFRFSRRLVREHTGFSYEQVRVHLQRLVDMEYLLVHRGRRGQSFEYELLYDGRGADGEPFVCGLLNVATLLGGPGPGVATMSSLGGEPSALGGGEGKLGVPLGYHTGPIPAPYRGTRKDLGASTGAAQLSTQPEVSQKALLGKAGRDPAYVPQSHNGAATRAPSPPGPALCGHQGARLPGQRAGEPC